MIVGDQRPVALDEVQQVRHLLQVRRNVGVVALEVGVVELDVDDVLDLSVGGVQLTRAVCPDRGRGKGRHRRQNQARRSEHDGAQEHPNSARERVGAQGIASFRR